MELAERVIKKEEEPELRVVDRSVVAPAEQAQQPAEAARERLILALQQQKKDAEAAQAAAVAKAAQSASLAARDARAAQVATEVAEAASAAIQRLRNVHVKKEEDEEEIPSPFEWPEAPQPSAPIWGCDVGALVMAPVISCMPAGAQNPG